MTNVLDTKKKIARVVWEARILLDISQKELGAAIGYSQGFIHYLEAGKSSLPAECIPLVVSKLRFKSVSDFWHKVEAIEVEFVDDGWT